MKKLLEDLKLKNRYIRFLNEGNDPDLPWRLNNNFDETQIESAKMHLVEKFGGLVASELAKSKIMALTLQEGVQIRGGSLVFYKAGADEELQLPLTKVEYNDVSNINEEMAIPFIFEFSTKEVRLSSEEWVQLFTNPDQQSLQVKAQKVAKVLSRVIMSLWFQNEVIDSKGNTLRNGDGAIPILPWTWTTNLVSSSRQEIAEEFDKFVFGVFARQVEAIRNIGFKDPITGENAFDPYRTGIEVNNTTYTIATSQNFKERHIIWSAHFNQSNVRPENGSYGQILGYDLFEDIFLPFRPQILGQDWTPTKIYDQDRKALVTTDRPEIIEFMFVKNRGLVKGTVFNYMWSEPIPKTNGAKVVGWNGKFGAGTINPDEMFAMDISGVEGPGLRINHLPKNASEVQGVAYQAPADIQKAIDEALAQANVDSELLKKEKKEAEKQLKLDAKKIQELEAEVAKLSGLVGEENSGENGEG